MLSKCANAACMARFHYLHEGRIFNLETGTASSESTRPPTRRIEHFWLCQSCARTLTLVLENGAVTTRALPRGRGEGAAQDRPERRREVA
jgi:hypothetical protein